MTTEIPELLSERLAAMNSAEFRNFFRPPGHVTQLNLDDSEWAANAEQRVAIRFLESEICRADGDLETASRRLGFSHDDLEHVVNICPYLSHARKAALKSGAK